MAVLSRKAGVRHIELVEDTVQSSLMAALTAWTTNGLPEDPGAWLYRVAHNRLLGALRQDAARLRLLDRAATDWAGVETTAAVPHFDGEVKDDLLRMLFVCCRDDIPRDSRLVLALKTLCGFSAPEIALRLFTSDANVYKRLACARERLREDPADLETPPLAVLASRLSSVHDVLYLLFNEGYLSAHAEQAIRRELCDEAIGLTTLLAEHPVGANPETFALLALMHLHASRLTSRQDGAGGLLLLEEQDRKLWDAEQIQLGMEWLERAASGETFSRYHAEAGIAAEHCLAPSFVKTRWPEIVDLYAMLEHVAPSPLPHAKQGRSGGRMAGAHGRAGCSARRRAASMAGWVLPMGCGLERSESARGKRRNRWAAPGASLGFSPHGGGAGPPPAATCP